MAGGSRSTNKPVTERFADDIISGWVGLGLTFGLHTCVPTYVYVGFALFYGDLTPIVCRDLRIG